MTALEYIGPAGCDACGWREESGPKVWRWWGGTVEVEGIVFADPLLCAGCLRKRGMEPPPREET